MRHATRRSWLRGSLIPVKHALDLCRSLLLLHKFLEAKAPIWLRSCQEWMGLHALTSWQREKLVDDVQLRLLILSVELLKCVLNGHLTPPKLDVLHE